MAEDIVLLKDHIAEIVPHPKQDTPLFGDTPLAVKHPALDLYSAAHSVRDARKLRQESVAVFFSMRPLCSLIFGSTNCPLGFEALVRSLLIGLHQAAIARDIGLEDRREPALTLACQLRIPLI